MNHEVDLVNCQFDYFASSNSKKLNIFAFTEKDTIIKKNIPIIEDVGEALGSKYSGKFLGNTGSDFSCFSFHAQKNITILIQKKSHLVQELL